MASEELFDELELRELETMEIFLTSKVSRTAITINEFIDARIAQGANMNVIKTALINDLKSGGRIFGEFRNAIKSTAIGSVNRMSDSAKNSEFGLIERRRWIAILVNSCDDCLSNHGELKTIEEWEASEFGVPRSGGTICRDRCKCELLPETTTELEPIQREKR